MASVKATITVGFENRGDAFGFCRVDKGAGVHDEYIGFGRVGGQIHPSRTEVPEHDFRVDQIFGATQRDETDFGGHKKAVRRGDSALATGGETEGLRAGLFVRAEVRVVEYNFRIRGFPSGYDKSFA